MSTFALYTFNHSSKNFLKLITLQTADTTKQVAIITTSFTSIAYAVKKVLYKSQNIHFMVPRRVSSPIVYT